MTILKKRNAVLCIGAACLALICALGANAQPVSYTIPAEPMGAALKDFALKSGKDVVFDPTLAVGKMSPGVKDAGSDAEALRQILAGSGLGFSQTGSGSFVVRGASKNVQAASNEAAHDDHANVETVTVTGSRLLNAPEQSAVEQRSYSREAIEKSGQPNLASFLQTLPEVSQASIPSGLGGAIGNSTNIQLRGFPTGTTLVLLDGHHAPNSAFSSGSAFDINNIPDALLARVDILPMGSSAVYGSDALAGAVNFVLRRDLNGLEASVARGSASHYEQYRASVSFGHQFEHGDFGIGLSYEGNGELAIQDRPAIANGNFIQYASLGGRDPRQSYYCNPGIVKSANGANLPGLSSSVATISPGIAGKPALSDFQSGVTAVCGPKTFSIIAGSSRIGALAYGDWNITDTIKLYGTMMFGHRRESSNTGGIITLNRLVPASNPYNPFGVPVSVTGNYQTSPTDAVTYTEFLHAEAGITGTIFDTWKWDLSGVITQDHDTNIKSNNVVFSQWDAALSSTDPSTAFNPFGTTAIGPVANTFLKPTNIALHDRSVIAEFVVRGPLLHLPAGDVQAAFGAQHENQDFRHTDVSFGTGANVVTSVIAAQRNVTSAFGEMRIPVLPALADVDQPLLVVSAAARWDQFNDFGETVNPQFGLEVRPAHPLLFRASYSEAFRAPTLTSLHAGQATLLTAVTDPTKNNASVIIPITSGGNANLKPETGRSYSFGMVWGGSELTGDLTASATWWHLEESNRVTNLSSAVVLANAALFPGNVTRDASGNLVAMSTQYLNFGDLIAEGVDVDAAYPFDTSLGMFTPRASATVTDRFQAAVLPGAPLVNRLGAASFTDAWAPNWKATLGIDWSIDDFGASFSGRYLGRYLDYQTPVNTNHLGNYWLLDATARVKIGGFLNSDEPLVRNATLSFSGVNILNRGPRYSNYYSGSYGYDGAEYDILGRYVSIRLGTSW